MPAPSRSRRIVHLLNATRSCPHQDEEPLCHSAYEALLPHISVMQQQAAYRLHEDAGEACQRAGLMPTEAAIFEMDRVFLTGRVPKASTFPIEDCVVSRPLSRGWYSRPILWLAVQNVTEEALTYHGGISVSGHYYDVEHGQAALLAHRVQRRALPWLIRHIAIWLCAESDEPAIASAVDGMLVANRLSVA